MTKRKDNHEAIFLQSPFSRLPTSLLTVCVSVDLEGGVDSILVFGALILKPVEHLVVDAQGNRGLVFRHPPGRICEKLWPQFRTVRQIDFVICMASTRAQSVCDFLCKFCTFMFFAFRREVIPVLLIIDRVPIAGFVCHRCRDHGFCR